MGIDFTILKKLVKITIDKLDHKNLNELEIFEKLNPSSEHIAMFIFDDIKEQLKNDRYFLYSVSVFETDNQGLTYYGDNEK